MLLYLVLALIYYIANATPVSVDEDDCSKELQTEQEWETIYKSFFRDFLDESPPPLETEKPWRGDLDFNMVDASSSQTSSNTVETPQNVYPQDSSVSTKSKARKKSSDANKPSIDLKQVRRWHQQEPEQFFISINRPVDFVDESYSHIPGRVRERVMWTKSPRGTWHSRIVKSKTLPRPRRTQEEKKSMKWQNKL